MNTKPVLLTAICLLLFSFGFAQLGEKKEVFTRQDTLRGSLNENLNWWDVLHYSILVEPDFDTKSIKGKVDIRFRVLRPGKLMQIDLQEPLIIDSIVFSDSRALQFEKSESVWLAKVPNNQKAQKITLPSIITVHLKKR